LPYYLCAPSRPALVFYCHHTAATVLYTLSLHDALPICLSGLVSPATISCIMSSSDVASAFMRSLRALALVYAPTWRSVEKKKRRSEEHTSELQSLTNLVCRLLLEKKKRPHLTSTQHLAP